MTTLTLGNLIDRALDHADMEQSDYPSRARLVDQVNVGLGHIYDMLIEAYGEDYFLEIPTSSYSLASGQEEYLLPTDFYKLVACYYISSGRRFKVVRYHPHDIDGYRTSPISTGSVEIWYAPKLKKFDHEDSDGTPLPFDLPNGWEEFVVLKVAQYLKGKAELDTTSVDRALLSEQARITRMKEPRDEWDPDAVVDYYGRWEGTRHLLRFDERYFKYRLRGQNKITFIEIEYIGI